MIEASLVSPLDSEYHANVATATPQLEGINLTTGLQYMRNNPPGMFCNTPLDNGSICEAVSHDQAHCFKPGGGMAGQQPAHWGTGKQGNDLTVSGAMTTSPSVPTSVTASAPSSQPVVIAAVASSWTVGHKEV